MTGNGGRAQVVKFSKEGEKTREERRNGGWKGEKGLQWKNRPRPCHYREKSELNSHIDFFIFPPPFH